MNINYVVSSMLFWWRENNLSFEQECDFLKSHGFGIELWPTIRGQDECRYDKRNWDRLASATEGMIVSMRSCQSCNGGLTQEKWAQQIECASMLGSNIVTDLRSLGIVKGRDHRERVSKIVNSADKKGVTLCVETGDLEEVLAAGNKYPTLRYCLDTGYANLDKRYSFNEYVDKLIGRVHHLHLTDNYGQIDDHEPPGLRGGIDRDLWKYLLDAINDQDREMIGALEMYPCMPAGDDTPGDGIPFRRTGLAQQARRANP